MLTGQIERLLNELEKNRELLAQMIKTDPCDQYTACNIKLIGMIELLNDKKNKMKEKWK